MIRQRVQRSELGHSSTWISLCPVALSPTQQEVVGLASLMVNREALSTYLPSAARPSPTPLCCLLAKIACFFTSSLSSESSHVTRGHLQILLHGNQWFLSLEFLAHFRQDPCYLNSESPAFPFSLRSKPNPNRLC